MIVFRFKPKFSVIIIFIFILFTIIGTLTHELGHITVAKVLGYETELSYGSMIYYSKGYNEDKDIQLLQEMNATYETTEFEALEDRVKKDYKALLSKIEKKFPHNKKYSFWVTLGGPLQTIVTTLIGLYILYRRESKYRYIYKLIDWLGVFLGLFILREAFNTITGSVSLMLFNKTEFYGDEFRISRYLELNQWIIPIITAIISLLITLYIIFKVIPLRYRFSFIVAGLIGGSLGYVIWFNYLGKIILP